MNPGTWIKILIVQLTLVFSNYILLVYIGLKELEVINRNVVSNCPRKISGCEMYRKYFMLDNDFWFKGELFIAYGSPDCGRNEQQIIYWIYYTFVAHALNPKSKTCWTLLKFGILMTWASCDTILGNLDEFCFFFQLENFDICILKFILPRCSKVIIDI